MGVRGDVLRHKKWNVWNPDNLDRVRRDKEKASADADALRTKEVDLARQHRLQALRQQAAARRAPAPASPNRAAIAASAPPPAAEPGSPTPPHRRRAVAQPRPPPATTTVRPGPPHSGVAREAPDSPRAKRPAYLEDLLRRSRCPPDQPTGDPGPPEPPASSAVRDSADLAELFFGDGPDGPPPAEDKKFAELWHDKTRHESFVKMVAQPDLSHAVNRGQREPEPFWTRLGAEQWADATAERPDKSARREAQSAQEDPLTRVQAYLAHKTATRPVAEATRPAGTPVASSTSHTPTLGQDPAEVNRPWARKRARSSTPSSSSSSSDSDSSRDHRKEKKKKKKEKTRRKDKEHKRAKKERRERRRGWPSLEAELQAKRQLLQALQGRGTPGTGV